MANGDEARRSGNLLTSLLSAAVVVLSATVAVLVWLVPDPETIATTVSKRLEKDGFLKEGLFNERMNVVDRAHEDIKNTLARIEAALGSCCVDGQPPPVTPGTLGPYLQVLFKNAGRNNQQLAAEDESVEEALARLTPESVGIALSDVQREELDKYAAAFQACAAGGRVRLKVQGYSSTREFVNAQGEIHRHSDALNVKTANLRARGVIDYLDDRGGANAANGVDVLHTPWRSYGAMRRPFLDVDDDFAGAEQEQLNRVVLVEIQDAGGCSVHGKAQ